MRTAGRGRRTEIALRRIGRFAIGRRRAIARRRAVAMGRAEVARRWRLPIARVATVGLAAIGAGAIGIAAIGIDLVEVHLAAADHAAVLVLDADLLAAGLVGENAGDQCRGGDAAKPDAKPAYRSKHRLHPNGPVAAPL